MLGKGSIHFTVATVVPIVALLSCAALSIYQGNVSAKLVPSISQLTAGSVEVYVFGVNVTIFSIAFAVMLYKTYQSTKRRIAKDKGYATRVMRVAAAILGTVAGLLYILASFFYLTEELYPHTYYVQGFIAVFAVYHCFNEFFFKKLGFRSTGIILLYDALMVIFAALSIALFYIGININSRLIFSISSICQYIAYILDFGKFMIMDWQLHPAKFSNKKNR